MKNLVYVILFILLGGCVSPSFSPVEIHQRVAEQVKVLIDSGYLQTPYIEINEVLSNDSSIIYSIKGSDSPGSDGAELPSKVMTYKGKYLCFIELGEQEMSRTELFEKGIVADSNFHENLHLDDGWVLALRKYENGSTLVKKVLSSAFLFEYPQLWSYFSGETPQGKPALMALFTHDIIVPDSCISTLFDLELDSMRYYIRRFSGKISVRNLTDSILLMNNSTKNMCYAVVNGEDTLKLILRDSLPVMIGPHGYRSLRYDSEIPYSFLGKLPDRNVWMSMYKLFSDSTFCFLNINGTPQSFRIIYGGNYFSYLRDSLSLRNRYIYNEGVDDKEERIRRFFKW